MRVLGVIVIITGLAAIVFGILFMPQTASANKEIEESVTPLKLDQVNDQYDAVSNQFNQMMAMEEPAIQGGTAAPSSTYAYIAGQRALLGLAKANIGTVKNVRMNGIIDIVVGVGLVLGGYGLMRKTAAAQ